MVSKALAVLLVGGAAAVTTVVVLTQRAKAGPYTPQLTSLVLTATPPTSISAGGSVSFQVSPKDQNGNPMAGVTGQMAEGGVPVAGTWTSGSNGVATVTLQFPAAGTFQVGATSGGVGGVTSNSVIVTVSGPPPPPQLTSLVLAATSSTSIAAGGSVSFSVTAMDQNTIPMSGISGQITEGGVPVPGTAFTTGATGVATVTLQFPSAGTFQVGAISGSITSATVAVIASAPPPPPTLLTATFIVTNSATNAPIVGSSVAVGSFPPQTTDATGTAKVPGLSPQTTYPVTIAASGYTTLTQNVTINLENPTFNVSLVAVAPPPPPPPPPATSFTVQSASATSTGATASVKNNLSTNSGPKNIHYEALTGTTVTRSATVTRGWNPGEIITQAATWAALAPGSYTLRVYVTDVGGLVAISNVLTMPFAV